MHHVTQQAKENDLMVSIACENLETERFHGICGNNLNKDKRNNITFI